MHPLAGFLAMAVLAGAGPSKPPTPSGPLIARGRGVLITADQFRAWLEAEPVLLRIAPLTEERKRAALEKMIRFELFAAEAKRLGIDRNPAVQLVLKRAMVQRLVWSRFDDAHAAAGVSDADARKYYEDHLREFQKPERIRLQGVFFKAEVGSPERAEKAAKAQEVLAQVASGAAGGPHAMAPAARDFSDDPGSRDAAGDLGELSREEMTARFTMELTAAAFNLELGQLSPVVETPRGYWIVRLNGRQPALDRSFEQEKIQIMGRIAGVRRTEEQDDFAKMLRQRAKVVIDEKELSRIGAAGPPPSRPPAAPATGPPAVAPRPVPAPASPPARPAGPPPERRQ